jgi:hypothetical protein
LFLHCIEFPYFQVASKMVGSKKFAIVILLGASLVGVANANTFLRANPSSRQERISEEEIQTSLLAEVEGTFGSGTATSRLKQMEVALTPMFAALPKNEHGYLGRATVRYALHRLFVQRHGWFINGLHAAGGHRNSTSTAGLLTEHVPAYVQDLFEKRLGGRGFGLHELGVLAATIEHLVHNEAVARLGDALKLHSLLPTSTMNASEVDSVLDTYMTGYILGENLLNMTVDEAFKAVAEMPDVFMAWNATQEFVRGVRQNISRDESSAEQRASGTLDFSLVVRVAERVGEQFGRFQDHECQQIKAGLMAKEEAGTGRVRLSDFWKDAHDNPDGAWQFGESLNYLRQLGVLDESDSRNPRVMIANYISSPSNCIASSSFYSVCCMDECEALIGHLEKEIAAPEAGVERITSVISKLPSSSVAAPRILSKTLLNRLEEIAAVHSGAVQLHGRLFAQWMHHAYPRECPYPHISGTTNPQTPDEWLESTGEEAFATEEEMRGFIYQGINQTEELDMDSLPWAPEEELLVVRPVHTDIVGSGSFMSRVRNVVLFAVMATMIYGLLRTSTVPSGSTKVEKLLV